MIDSKYAEISDLSDARFVEINKAIEALNLKYNLPDHATLNKARFLDNPIINASGTFYGARMWEYPFAIINAELKEGMTCADIGCGSTPFTPYLASVTGQNTVTGFDNDFLENDNTHFAFGVRKEFIKDTGIQFKFSGMEKIDAQDNSFDRVFCISVLEHIDNPAIWQKGLKEMARILKPDGRLILTFDFALSNKYLSIGDVLNYTGLIPCNFINMNWPTDRFVKVESLSMDVFGLVLQKPSGTVYTDHSKMKSIPRERALTVYVPEVTYPHELQIAKDINRGKLLTVSKIVLNRYKK
ncbi:class I SAM-dependent methyltransferase [Aurantibacillus circumpalustris]|uniref:class I SAM-dependent methyltransferase n=1 Tax=Aurantibacillus circumpalustris TaxID=3036359 RepID=UPI00295BDD65|nr:class I SAM-dependent methyltransferase [Aurantibacillus circumpalustris]